MSTMGWMILGLVVGLPLGHWLARRLQGWLWRRRFGGMFQGKDNDQD